jgi:hypothetical protein
MLYDYELTYESSVFVNLLSKDLCEMLQGLNMVDCKYGNTLRISHKVSVKDATTIPKQEFIEATRKQIFECLHESFAKENGINVDVIETRFLGIVNLIEKET